MPSRLLSGTVRGQDKADRKGRKRTSGHYDALGNDADGPHLVTHAPVVEDLCHIWWHTDSAVLA
jgi:hypothetical protein